MECRWYGIIVLKKTWEILDERRSVSVMVWPLKHGQQSVTLATALAYNEPNVCIHECSHTGPWVWPILMHFSKLHVYATALIYTRGKSNCCLISCTMATTYWTNECTGSCSFDGFCICIYRPNFFWISVGLHVLLLWTFGGGCRVYCTLLMSDITENCPVCTGTV